MSSQIIYEGPPHYERGVLVEGKKFHLSGRPMQAKEGVELARGLSGILLPMQEYRYDTSADQPGSTFVSTVINRRRIESAINVFGDTKEEFAENWTSWVLNNPTNQEGKLWFISPGKEDRYAFVRPNSEAGSSSLDIDPYLYRKMENLTWGWESDYPYFFGEKQRHYYSSGGSVSIVNPSDAEEVYPKVYLSGPGSYVVGDIKTPVLTKDEMIRINFDPIRKTYVKRNTVTGEVTNLWYTLNGKRPELTLRSGESLTHKITMPGNTGAEAYLEFTPLYQGAL